MDENKITISNQTIWFLVVIVFVSIMVCVYIVFTHDKVKPNSPQSLVAAAFNQLFTIQEWKPGMGPKPLLYHPAAFKEPVWKPLPPGIINPSANMPGAQLQTQQWKPLNYNNPNMIRK